jgi:Cu+-exporting ATPase
MNVLIALGAVAAFGYSLYGTLIGQAEHYMFYETAAAIITLVFLATGWKINLWKPPRLH